MREYTLYKIEIKYFYLFLQNKKIKLSTIQRYMRDLGHSNDNDVFYLIQHYHSRFFFNAFSWSDTDEGYNYWLSINFDYENYYFNTTKKKMEI